MIQPDLFKVYLTAFGPLVLSELSGLETDTLDIAHVWVKIKG